jgi:hypothetical protein
MQYIQKIATKVFMLASIAFGIVGLMNVYVGPGPDDLEPHRTLLRLLFTTVFILLPAFALSVAGKYLKD